MDGRIDRWRDLLIFGWKDRPMERSVDRWMDRWIESVY